MYTMDEFEDLLNERTCTTILGRHSFGAGTILRKCDPEQFNIEYHDWLAYLEECEEDRVN